MANEQSKLTNRYSRQVKATDAKIEAFTLRLGNFISRNTERLLGQLQLGNKDGVETANILGSLLSEMKSAGLDKEVAKLKSIYADELLFIKDSFNEIDIEQTYTDADKPMINALIDNSIEKVSVVVRDRGLDVQAQVMQQVLTGQEFNIPEIASGASEATQRDIKTELNTSVSVFSRTIAANKAEELGLDLFIYLGPTTEGRIKIRPFCKHLLFDRSPPIYTKEEIARMDNGQTPSVQTTGGGYNCRHHWQPISEERAKELGYSRNS